MNKEACQRCGAIITSYKILIRDNEWGCRSCAKDIETHG